MAAGHPHMTIRKASLSALNTRPSAKALVVMGLGALALSGCSMLQEDKVDYTSAKRVSTLEVPPDLTQLSKDSRFTVPGSVVTASGYQQAQPATPSPVTAASTLGAGQCAGCGRNFRIRVVATCKGAASGGGCQSEEDGGQNFGRIHDFSLK